jgi:RNA polymerase sigma factor (sigma-70 family)
MNPRLLAPARLARSILRTQSDERLAELAAAGSDAAFEALVARHRRALLGHCARLVGATDAEEAVQDALLRALAALRGGDEIRRVRPWLHVIAHRVALNLHRARAARGECALADVGDGERADDGGPAAARAQLRDVVAALGELPPRQREAIVMRELEGRSYAEIAERLDSSPGAVRQLLHRARAGVRQRVAGVLAWEPLARWASSVGVGGSGSRLGAVSDACLATAKVCAALVVPATLGAGSVLSPDHRGAPRPAAPTTSAHVSSSVSARPARAKPAAVAAPHRTTPHRAAAPAAPRVASAAPRPAVHVTRPTVPSAVRFVSVSHSAPTIPRRDLAPSPRRTTSTTRATPCPPAAAAAASVDDSAREPSRPERQPSPSPQQPPAHASHQTPSFPAAPDA